MTAKKKTLLLLLFKARQMSGAMAWDALGGMNAQK